MKTTVHCRWRSTIAAALAGVLAFAAGSVKAGTVYVSKSGSDAGDGLSWASAKATVQAGLNAAVSGDEVWVAAGVYVERVALKQGVALYGGFVGGETDLAQRNWVVNRTVLDGNQGGSVVTAPVGATSTARIDGFTIQNGQAYYGAGIYCQGASPAIANNTITGNSATLEGGGIYCTLNAAATIANNVIAGNLAPTASGIYCNRSAAMITGNVILGNLATSAAARGVGIYCQGTPDPTIANNTIAGNSTIDSNTAEGAGIFCDHSCSATIVNTIIAFNSSGIRKISGPGNPTLRYNCVYGNGKYNYSGLADPTGTNGNISADPNLADLPYRKSHIQPDSPCRDAGDDGVVQTGWTDIDGQARILGPHVDIGADESDGTTWSGVPDRIVRVAPEGDDTNDGSSWPLAKRNVQAAIDDASACAGDVWVKEGTYAERITLRSFVHVYGGFAGTETQRTARDWSAHATVLDGGQGGSVVTARLLARGASTIDGFTLCNGSGTLLNFDLCGGGVYSSCASPTIANNTVTANTAAKGGGIYCDSFGPLIAGNTITANSTTDTGGGIYCDAAGPTITGNTISGNSASGLDGDGGGIACNNAFATITGNTITRNTSTGADGGGGIYCYGGAPAVAGNTISYNVSSAGGGVYCTNSSVAISGNRIVGNTSGFGANYGFGGGICCYGSGSPIVTGNTIMDNTSLGNYGFGGGIYCQGSPVIANNAITGNGAQQQGGGIFCASSAVPSITNNTVAGNTARHGGAVYCNNASPTITNTIMAFNSSGIYRTGGGTLTLAYNCTYGNPEYNYYGLTDPAGTNGNFSADPRFAALPYGNLHIQPGSPCIDAGDGTRVQAGWTDIDGQPRVRAPQVDIGADESDGTTWAGGPNAIVRVATDGNDAHDGSSWSLAKRTVQAGIDAAALVGGEVWVKAGTYFERISLPGGVHLYGGFAGTEADRAARNWAINVTTLDGSQGGRVVSASYIAAAMSTLDGFTVRNGKGSSGGGVYAHFASLVIANNTIIANTVTDHYAYGGGIYCWSCAPTIINNTITGNVSTGNYTDNRSGGGIYCYASGSATIANNTIFGNTAHEGGGIYSTGTSTAIAGNTIFGNSASEGGGIYCSGTSAVVGNNTIVGNSAPDGGGVYIWSSTTIVNTIIAFNSSGIYKYGTYGTPVSALRANCVYGNGTKNYSGLGDPTGTDGNISADPHLVRLPGPGPDGLWATADDDSGDLRLLPGSRCIDAGSNADVPADSADLDADGNTIEPLPVDRAGAPRFADDPYAVDTGSGTAPIVDIGAYEHRCGDVDGDGLIDVVDLLWMVDAFGTQPGDAGFDARCDFNADGLVDVVDLLDLVYNFGQ